MNRRDFLKGVAASTAALTLGRHAAYAYSASLPLQKFIAPLQGLGPTGIPLASPDTATYPGVDYYNIEVASFQQQLHPGLPGPTRLYGYADLNGAHRHLGGVIAATKGKPVRIKVANKLPSSHILPFDSTIMGATSPDRAAIHLHGGLVPWASDGGPFHWIPSAHALDKTRGASVTDWLPDSNGNLTADHWYPNNQSARLMWYHDHALGITRLNAYAGIASAYVIADAAAEAFLNTIPAVPLIFQDKVFWNPANDPGYSTFVTGASAGDLWYPYIYDPEIWMLAPDGAPPVPSAIAEFFGDTMLVNGTVYPTTPVNRGMYRLRLLNACNARFLNLSFVVEDPDLPGEPLFRGGKPVVAPVTITQVGTEGGFLPAPVPIVDPLLLAPAERADLVVDFSLVPTGTKLILYNDAPAPFPDGEGMFDIFVGGKKKEGGPLATPGFGPNTRTLMQWTIQKAAGSRIPVLPATLPVPVLPTMPDAVNGGLMVNAAAVTSVYPGFIYNATPRPLTLNEAFDMEGRLMQLLGTNVASQPGVFGKAYTDPATETVSYRTIEVWDIYNLTADTHPMHFHLFNVMVLGRRAFNAKQFSGLAIYNGRATGPAPNETGWKETVRMNPGEITRIAILVEHPLPGRTVSVGPYTGILPVSPRTGSDEYVWHCHILEHEEHDMMRPLLASPTS